MPFMVGKTPIRRTMQYLELGRLFLNNRIRIFCLNYNTTGEHHQGAKEFAHWNLPQVQYKNPDVQVMTLKNMTPSPFIRLIYDDGKEMLVDCDSKSNSEILQHLIKIAGKSQQVLALEAQIAEKKVNPANFGMACERVCICMVPGQVPCPGVVPLPNHMRGKYKYAKN